MRKAVDAGPGCAIGGGVGHRGTADWVLLASGGMPRLTRAAQQSILGGWSESSELMPASWAGWDSLAIRADTSARPSQNSWRSPTEMGVLPRRR